MQESRSIPNRVKSKSYAVKWLTIKLVKSKVKQQQQGTKGKTDTIPTSKGFNKAICEFLMKETQKHRKQWDEIF